MAQPIVKKSTSQIDCFLAGDHTRLQEVLHSKNDGIDLPYSLAKAYLSVGTRSLAHRLAQMETYYFLSGIGKLMIDEEEHQVGVGDVVIVPAFASQYLINTGDEHLSFLCIVSPPWTAEGEQIEE